MVIFKIFIIGFAILISALIINGLASKIGLVTWYDFLKQGAKVEWYEYLWLFIFYPFLLGLSVFYIDKIIK